MYISPLTVEFDALERVVQTIPSRFSATRSPTACLSRHHLDSMSERRCNDVVACLPWTKHATSFFCWMACPMPLCKVPS